MVKNKRQIKGHRSLKSDRRKQKESLLKRKTINTVEKKIQKGRQKKGGESEAIIYDKFDGRGVNSGE